MSQTGNTSLVTGGADSSAAIWSKLFAPRRPCRRDRRSFGRDDGQSRGRGRSSAIAIRARQRGRRSDIARCCSGVTEVYHLAAAVGVGLIASHPIETIETNIAPTERLAGRIAAFAHAPASRCGYFSPAPAKSMARIRSRIWTEDDDMVFGPTTRARWSYGVSKAIDEFLVLGLLAARSIAGRGRAVVQRRRSAAIGAMGNGAAAVGVGGTGRPVADRPRRRPARAVLRPCGRRRAGDSRSGANAGRDRRSVQYRQRPADEHPRSGANE